jgi:hypothetical protein
MRIIKVKFAFADITYLVNITYDITQGYFLSPLLYFSKLNIYLKTT